MRKLLALALALCLMASLLCITASAANAPKKELPAPSKGTVLRVSALKDGELVLIEDYTSFEDGWNAAMELADDPDELTENRYSRVVVDIYEDWKAVDGEFTDDTWNGPGFDWDTIYIQDGVKITLNLNGNTIDRGLETWEYNGEVICIDEYADVIINDGTITGGYSCNGGGGIHIKMNANVTLNNVNVKGNKSDDDSGAGIYTLGGLTMNGGSIRDNVLTGNAASLDQATGAGLHAAYSSVVLDGVEIVNNQCEHSMDGAAIFAVSCTLTMKDCKVIGNGVRDDASDFNGARSIIYLWCTNSTITGTTFENNGGYINDWDTPKLEDENPMINFRECPCYIDSCTFTNNTASCIISDSDYNLQFSVSNSKFFDNKALVYTMWQSPPRTFTNCEFNNNWVPNTIDDGFTYTFDSSRGLTFENCKMGDSNYTHEDKVTFVNCDFDDDEAPEKETVPPETAPPKEEPTIPEYLGSIDTDLGGSGRSPERIASIFGEGSLSVVISMAALVIAAAALGVAIASNKKKATAAPENDE